MLTLSPDRNPFFLFLRTLRLERLFDRHCRHKSRLMLPISSRPSLAVSLIFASEPGRVLHNGFHQGAERICFYREKKGKVSN